MPRCKKNNRFSEFPTRFKTNLPEQPRNKARTLKVWVKEDERPYYPSSKTNAPISGAVTESLFSCMQNIPVLSFRDSYVTNQNKLNQIIDIILRLM